METRIVNAITTTTAPLNYGDLERLALSIAKSGLFGIKTPDQAMALMMIAAAEGRHPALAARDFDIINGRPAKKAEAMMRDFVQAGGRVEWHALTDELADATFTHPQTGSVRIDWDMKRATTAFGKKDMYSKFPRQMLRSRVVSEGIRTLWPLATSGMYVPEEVGNLPPHNGPTIDHEAEAEAEAPPPPLRAAAAPTPRAPRKVADAQAEEAYGPAETPHDRWMAKLRAALDATTSAAEAEAVGERESVKDYFGKASPGMRRDITAELARGYGRHAGPQNMETPDDLHIEGEHLLAAG